MTNVFGELDNAAALTYTHIYKEMSEILQALQSNPKFTTL